jgi:hypothetical protein
MLFIFISNKSLAQDTDDDKDVVIQQDTIVAATHKPTYFLDGKQVPEHVIYEKAPKGELGDGFGYPDSREAIRKYGEQYRYGVWFFDSKTTN